VCDDDGDCSGGVCDKNNITTDTDNVCVDCTGNGDCSGSQYCAVNQQCKTKESVGASCDSNAWCKSGDCAGNKCVCKKASDCGSGKACDTNSAFTATDNKCITAKKMGNSCNQDSECGTGKCEGTLTKSKRCVCKDDGDCSSGYECKTFGLNECKKK